jgi:hypothetical protein
MKSFQLYFSSASIATGVQSGAMAVNLYSDVLGDSCKSDVIRDAILKEHIYHSKSISECKKMKSNFQTFSWVT